MTTQQCHETYGNERVGRDVHVKIDKGVKKYGDETRSSTEDESELVTAFSFADVPLRHANRRPGFSNPNAKENKCRRDEKRAGNAPVRESVQKVVVSAFRLHLNSLRTKSAKPPIEV